VFHEELPDVPGRWAVILALLFFLSGVATDVVWAFYIRAIADGARLRAALYSVGTGIFGIILVEGTILNVYLTPCWLAGLFVGTFYSTRKKK
jgi:hypothetical protein